MNLFNFTEKLTERLTERKKQMGLTYFDSYKIFITEGKKYFKVFKSEVKGENISNGSIVAFIDKTTGDIFKPATYNTPAKHARGCVLSAQDGMEAFTPDGFVRYLK